MAKPILFTTISRNKYDALSDEDKSKKNYIIKEEDGSSSKAIGKLEGSGGDNIFIVEIEQVNSSGFRTKEKAKDIYDAAMSGKVIISKHGSYVSSISNYISNSPYSHPSYYMEFYVFHNGSIKLCRAHADDGSESDRYFTGTVSP